MLLEFNSFLEYISITSLSQISQNTKHHVNTTNTLNLTFVLHNVSTNYEMLQKKRVSGKLS